MVKLIVSHLHLHRATETREKNSSAEHYLLFSWISNTYTCILRYEIHRATGALFESKNLACLFRLLIAIVLHVNIRPNPPNKIHFPHEYSRPDICDFAGAIYIDGTTVSAPFPSLSFHSRTKSRLLGAECLGLGDGNRSRATTVYGFCRRSLHWFWFSSPVAHRFNLDFTVNNQGIASASRGLVGDTVFAVIPNVKPIHTFLVALCFQMVWRYCSGETDFLTFIRCTCSSYGECQHIHHFWTQSRYVGLHRLCLGGMYTKRPFSSFLCHSGTLTLHHAKSINAHAIQPPGRRQLCIFQNVDDCKHRGNVFAVSPPVYPSRYARDISRNSSVPDNKPESPVKVIYSLVWGVMIFQPLYKQVYEWVWPLNTDVL